MSSSQVWMPAESVRSNLEILIVSCDRFHDTWDPVVASFEKYWPDRPFATYLLTNEREFVHTRVRGLRIGPDVDWSSGLLSALDHVRSSHVLLWLDDVFLSANVSNDDVQAAFNFAVKQSAEFVRLRPDPKPKVWRADGFGELARHASYRVSVFATIWRVETLRKLIRPGESPWQFELRGTERALALPGFYCTQRSVFSCVHGIEKGLWLREAVRWLQLQDHRIDERYRRQMSSAEHRKYVFGRLKYHAISLLPERSRKKALQMARRFYICAGLRRPEFYNK